MANKVIMTMGVGNGDAARPGVLRWPASGGTGRRHQHPPRARRLSAIVEPARSDADGEAGHRFVVRLGATRATTSPSCSSCTREGQLDLDGLVTKTYPLEGINDGYDDMRAGKNIRGVLVYE